MLRIGWVVIMVAGCVEPTIEVCSDGTVCPSGTTCVTITYTDATTSNYCANPGQLGECTEDGAPCADGSCHGGACLASACGNRLLDSGEICDDGNTEHRDGCASDCLSNEECGNGIVDATMGEQCDEGADYLDHDGCTSTCKSEALSWRDIAFAGRFAAMATYDEVRDRVVLWGGESFFQLSGETWEWDGTRWELRDSPVRPGGRRYARLVYDPERQESVLFGDHYGATSTWTLDTTGWHVRTPATSPPTRVAPVMAYDAVGKRVVMYGGGTQLGGPKTDTWAWDGASWQELTTTGTPPGSNWMAMAFDPATNKVVLVNDAGVYELSGSAWTLRPTVGGPQALGGYAPELAYDPLGNGLMLVGGNQTAGEAATWRLTGSTWTRLADVPLTEVRGHTLTTDGARRRVVLHVAARTYEWTGSGWEQRSDSIAKPDWQVNSGYATDPRRHEVLRFGGGTGPLFDDTWWWNGAWNEYTGNEPPPRAAPTMCYDATRDGILMFGGLDSGGALADTWLWKDHAWTQQLGGAQPPPRYFASLAYDASRARVVMFGGRDYDFADTQRDDTWTWDGSWHPHTPATSPPRRDSAAMGYDPMRERVVLFGGFAGIVDFDDTWEWDGTTWTKITTANIPLPQHQASLVWDASLRSLVLAGGITGQARVSEIWAYDGNWRLLETSNDPPAIERVIASPDGTGVISVTTSSADNPAKVDRMWRMRYTSGATAEACTDVDTDGDGRAGCADPDCFDRCTPLCPPMTTCPAGSPGCGDGACDTSLESKALCPADCP